MMKLTVGRNGEDFFSIQEALNAVPYAEDAEIIISEGFYREKIFSDKHSLRLRGEGNVVISYDDYGKEILSDGLKRGTFRSYTAFFSGEYLEIENIRIENTAGKGSEVGQALALYLDADYAKLRNVTLFGHQDTLFLAPLPQMEREKRGFYGPRVYSRRKLNRVIFEKGAIYGGVDFIFGGADALFTDADIISDEEGYVAAPSGFRKDTGFVFSSCRFSSQGVKDHSVYLMRPWRKEGKAAFIDCTFQSHINPDGFIPWHGLEGERDEATFLVNSAQFGKEHFISDEDAEKLISSFDF